MFAIMSPVNMYVQLPFLIVIILVEAFRWGSRMVFFLVAIAVVLYLVALWLGN
jgi:hypothetical protein